MKKFFIITSLIFLLSSCFSSQDDGLKEYSSKDFSLRIPNNWEIIDNKDGIIPKPRSGEIEFAIRSKSETNGFFNNLIILSEENKNSISIEEYSKSKEDLKNEYFEYKKINVKDLIFTDKSTSKITIFEARYNNQTPKIKFLQTTKICNNKKIYHITLALDKYIKDTEKYEYMISNFNCKK